MLGSVGVRLSLFGFVVISWGPLGNDGVHWGLSGSVRVCFVRNRKGLMWLEAVGGAIL